MSISMIFVKTLSKPVRSSSMLLAILCASATAATCQTNSSKSYPGDAPETGLQGQVTVADVMSGRVKQPYFKGVRVVGHTDIGNRGGNLLMSKVDSCAYVSSTRANSTANGSNAGDAESAVFLPPSAGVAVIDVSNPHAPRLIRTLRDKGSINAVETMYAISTAERKVLVAGAYTGGVKGSSPESAAWLDIYDVSDCRNPKLTNEYKWPENSHMITLSPNGKRVYGTSINPFTGNGGIQILDITDMAHPRFLGKFGATRPDGSTYEFAPHEVSLSADEKRIYAGVVGSKGDDFKLPAGAGIMEKVGPNAGGVYIFDNTDVVERHTDIHLRLISEVPHGGWHSVVPANINGVPYLVGAGELGSCPGAWPKIINIADEKKPIIESEFKLQMNESENCGKSMFGNAEGTQLGNIASHFNDVDDATQTRLGIFPFVAGGLRIVDLREPKHPVEVGYFKPPAHPGTILNAGGTYWLRLAYNDQVSDACMSHALYVPETGQIWFACVSNGFYVIDLVPELRKSMGFPSIPEKHSARTSSKPQT